LLTSPLFLAAIVVSPSVARIDRTERARIPAAQR
jgi:hypothetical protein